MPPPAHSVRRVSGHANAFFHLDCAIEAVREEDGRLRIQASRGCFSTDFVIAATGFRNDFADRPELGDIAPHILCWGERPDFPPELPRDGPFGQSPYLAGDFTFQERRKGACPALSRIHCFNDAATLSQGKVSGDIPAVSAGAKRLAASIVAGFFTEDVEEHFDRLQAYDVPELDGSEYAIADRLP